MPTRLTWAAAACASALLATATIPRLARAADDRVRDWFSPDRTVKLSSVLVGTPDAPDYELRLTRAGHPPVVIDTYMRSVDVSWSPDSVYLAVTDWIGSNVGDCMIVDTRRPAIRLNLSRALPRLRENTMHSHFYVACETWIDTRHIGVRAFGHTDYPPSHDFEYRFVYNGTTRKMVADNGPISN